MEGKALQPLKQYLPIFVTELGKVMAVRPVQPKKQLFPKLVTELGMVMEVRPVQPSNILSIDNQQFIS